ncbi:MAG: hypothetical protein FWG88_01480 [Oscillospiraceae bacterium]|nr:hypothetical protein [Oscillospiraceae bacterium]
MQKYELTERGKILVVSIVVVILLVLSAILMIRANANQSPIDTSPSTSEQTPMDTTPMDTASPISDTSESPPPSGGGFGDDENIAPSDENGDDDEIVPSHDNSNDDNNNDETNDETNDDLTDISNENDDNSVVSSPPIDDDIINIIQITGPTGGNPKAGTLIFLFAPDYQNEIDSQTQLLLSDFLLASSNNENSTIAIETPLLSAEHSQVLMTAMVDAFAQNDIPEYRISHIQRETPDEVKDEETTIDGVTIIEVSLYYITSGGK